MKRFVLALVLLISAMVLFGQNYYGTLSMTPYIYPQYAGFTYYDYMAGAYNAYPIRLQERTYLGGNYPLSNYPQAAYMTFMKTVPGSTTRRQVRTVYGVTADASGDAMLIHQAELNINDTGAHEGFGTLAMEPVTGSPIIAWHSVYPDPGNPNDLNPNIYIISESNALDNNMFGQGFSPAYLLRENANSGPATEFIYYWPIVHTGPSPTAGKTRIYVFANNGGRSHQPMDPDSETGEDHIPSSSEWFIYADVDANFFVNGGAFDPLDQGNIDNGIEIVWSEPQEIPYFLDIHNFDPNDYPQLGITKNLSVRAFGSSNVATKWSRTPGRVAYAGELGSDFTQGLVWPRDNFGEHEFYVVYNDNYGQAGEWRVIPFYLSSPQRWSSHGGWGHFYTDENNTASLYRFGPGAAYGVNEDIDNIRIDSWSLGHKNVIVDEHGFVQFPVVMAPGFTHDNVVYEFGAATYYYSTMASVYVARVNPDTTPPEIFLHPILPRPEEGLMYYPDNGDPYPVEFPFVGTSENPPHATVSWDQNNDNWFDPQFNPLYPDGQQNTYGHRRYTVLPEIYPANKYLPEDNSGTYKFHTNYIRMTNDTGGFIAILWADGAKANEAEDYPDDPDVGPYRGKPEIYISASMNHGRDWTEPFSLSQVTHPEIFPADRYPEYLYPADRLIPLSNDSFRMYIMSVSDLSYGTFATMSAALAQGTNDGAEIQYLALDFTFNEHPTTDTDITLVKPDIKMLSQNYPNPFNPSTTICFNLPVSGNVKLSVYNVKGQLVKTLINGYMVKNTHEVVWNGVDENNVSVGSGVYFYRLEANGKQETKKMILMK